MKVKNSLRGGFCKTKMQMLLLQQLLFYLQFSLILLTSSRCTFTFFAAISLPSSYSLTNILPSFVIPSVLMYISSQVELLKNSTVALPWASVLMSGFQ